MKRTTPWMTLMLLLALAGLESGGMAQMRRDPFPSSRSSETGAPPIGPSRTLKMQKESFEQTQKDTAQLYEMVSELKAEMDNTTEDVLSVTVMKKAEAIEKLAEKIKNRMKNL
jgi:hypothetical protein